jgi:hypothetical protein
MKLLNQLGVALKDKVEFRTYTHYDKYNKTIEASVIAMTMQDFQANYAPTMMRRRGIADGTMAIMQNGEWKVIGQPSPVVAKKEEKVYNKKSAVDYLTDKMRNS